MVGICAWQAVSVSLQADACRRTVADRGDMHWAWRMVAEQQPMLTYPRRPRQAELSAASLRALRPPHPPCKQDEEAKAAVPS